MYLQSSSVKIQLIPDILHVSHKIDILSQFIDSKLLEADALVVRGRYGLKASCRALQIYNLPAQAAEDRLMLRAAADCISLIIGNILLKFHGSC